MTNVEKIAKLRGISSDEAIEFWKDVSAPAGLRLSTYDVLTELLAQGAYATSISACQLANQSKLIAATKEEIYQEKLLAESKATEYKEFSARMAAQRKAESEKREVIANLRASPEKTEEEKEFRQLVAEISALGFTRSNQVSHYIRENRLGYRYQHISGILEMEQDNVRWSFDGGFPGHIYARLCEELELENQGSQAKPIAFIAYKDVV